jgi:ketosteroid isomerase-like protein
VLVCFIAVVLLGGCRPGGAPDPEVLMEADRAFSAETGEGGSEAWASWFAEDGAMVQPEIGEIRGRDAIRAFVTYLDDPGVSFSWEPERAEIAASGDLGWTTGRYVAESRLPDGSVARSEGIYVSIWKRQPDGAWKVVMDLGDPLTPQPQ